MKIPLYEFEQHIDGTILKKGFDYFKKGHVHPPGEVSPGVYETVVEGSEKYEVQVTVKNDALVNYRCNCPYDSGPVCKHVAAVLFYLQKDALGIGQDSEPAKKKGAGKTAGKKKTVAAQVDELLEKIAPDELKKFVRELASSDRTIRQAFLSRYAHAGEGESKELYARQLKEILRAAKDRTGFVHYGAARSVGKAVSDFCVTAGKHAAEGNFKSAIYIAAAVLEEMTKALQFADDSSGDIGEGISASMDILNSIAKSRVPEEVRVELLQYCYSAFRKKIFKDWDWHLGMLQVAAKLVANNTEGEMLFTLLEEYRKSEDYADYTEGLLKMIQLAVLQKIKDKETVQGFIESNLGTTAIRAAAIERAMEAGNYPKAKQLAMDGLHLDRNSSGGIKSIWYEWLLKIAQAEKDNIRIKEYARLLFMDAERGRPGYYELLKATVEPSAWKSFVEELAKEVIEKKQWLAFDIVSWIYIQEQWWSRLIGLLKARPSLSYIEHFEKYLAKEYSGVLAELYEEGVIALLISSTGRNHYKQAVRYITRMKKLGEGERAAALADMLRKQYPQRYALLDELNKV